MGPKSVKRRRSSRCCSMMSVIPIDIFASEILPRLPPRTLLRFKCLNKFFYHYISSKQFIDLQLRHSTNHSLFVFIALGGFGQHLFMVDVDSSVSRPRPRYLSLPPPFSDRNRCLKVIACCNGLLCLQSSNGGVRWTDALIVNPSTGSILSNISLPTEIMSVTCSGFGYRSLSKDYELVVVEVEYQRHGQQFGDPTSMTIHRKVSVFSIKSNSWRCIETTYLGAVSQVCVPNLCSTCVLIDNCLMHWLLKSPAGNNSRNLVCFNLEKEQWVDDISLPNYRDYDKGRSCYLDLGVLDGCLCFSLHNYDNKYHVWTMKEHGVHGSWTKFLVDIPDHCLYNPVFACQPAPIKEILLVKALPDKTANLWIQTYVWYNIRDKTAKKIQFSGAPAPRAYQYNLLCFGSLANCLGDCQTQKCKATGERVFTKDGLKIDDDNVIRSCIPTDVGGIIQCEDHDLAKLAKWNRCGRYR